MLGLAAILAAAGTVQAVELVTSARLASAARAVAATMRAARGRALADGIAIEATFDTVRGVWKLRKRGVLLETHTLPPRITFGTLPARARILFGALGTAENGTIQLAAGARSRSVVVNQRGRVRLQ